MTPGLPDWEARIRQLINADSPDAAIAEMLDCLPLTSTVEQLAALDDVIGYYRHNEKRMRYRYFRSLGLPGRLRASSRERTGTSSRSA
ncbi:MAG: hypothetical protein ACYC8T_35945 [Myxococcaceae bacterium]